MVLGCHCLCPPYFPYEDPAGYCYFRSSTTATYTEAMTSCRNLNSRLVFVDSAAKAIFLDSTGPYYDSW